jgi:hypothetical protein
VAPPHAPGRRLTFLAVLLSYGLTILQSYLPEPVAAVAARALTDGV